MRSDTILLRLLLHAALVALLARCAEPPRRCPSPACAVAQGRAGEVP